jgi:MinD superfamily P-loop ATPase
VCRENAILWVEGKTPLFFSDLCNGCGACWIACPNNAITTKKQVIGEVFTTQINDHLWLVTGRSKPRVAETGPIVKEVKQHAFKLAEKIGADILLVDTSPGTHCNVIHALRDCRKAYVVTEPTPLGAHDAGLILKLLQIMQIPSDVVLNKSDVGDKKAIDKIAAEYGVSITVEIPYSDKLVEAYSEGRLDKMVNLI